MHSFICSCFLYNNIFFTIYHFAISAYLRLLVCLFFHCLFFHRLFFSLPRLPVCFILLIFHLPSFSPTLRPAALFTLLLSIFFRRLFRPTHFAPALLVFYLAIASLHVRRLGSFFYFYFPLCILRLAFSFCHSFFINAQAFRFSFLRFLPVTYFKQLFFQNM